MYRHNELELAHLFQVQLGLDVFESGVMSYRKVRELKFTTETQSNETMEFYRKSSDHMTYILLLLV